MLYPKTKLKVNKLSVYRYLKSETRNRRGPKMNNKKEEEPDKETKSHQWDHGIPRRLWGCPEKKKKKESQQERVFEIREVSWDKSCWDIK